MAVHNELGRWGEDTADDYLREKGYVILERDWHSGHRDIDIIALHNGTIVFVEVKTRQNRRFTEPELAVGYQKIRYLQAAMNHYVKTRRNNYDLRFDIITVVGDIGSTPEVTHIEDVPII